MALQDYEQVSARSPGLAQHTAYAQEVIQSVGATRTLLPRESGALCLLDRAAGVVYTLPTPVVGMTFKFLATVSVTSNAYKVITSSAAIFLVGAVVASSLTAGAQDTFVANGTTHVAISAAGVTTGGLVGEYYEVTAISATQWAIHGVTQGSGTLADPFATS
jgi:hypothetical protein